MVFKHDALLYCSSAVIASFGLAYSFVPFYKLFCQTTGFGGTPRTGHAALAQDKMVATSKRPFKVSFIGQSCNSLPWKFSPIQNSITVKPGETALAFYNAENMSDRDIIGVATYNVSPDQAGPYFNKIQCFCFEEQKLLPKESVEMPVFFYIDPDITKDPFLMDLKDVTLSYSFYEVKNPVLN